MEPAQDASSPPVERPARPSVLLIDDEPAVRDLVAEMLAFVGCNVDRAAAGPEGLALFERNHYDLVVTDLDMPGMTGWEVITAVRQREPTRGVILTTGTPIDIDGTRTRELDVTVLPKPFHLAALREAVEQMLRRRSGARGPASGAVSSSAVISSPTERTPMAQDSPTRFAGELGAVIEAIRRTAGDLDVVAKATEVLLREHEALQGRLSTLEREYQTAREGHAALQREHETASTALARLREEHEALRGEHQALRAEHEAGVRALAAAREEAQVLTAERQSAVDALEALVSRLRR